MRYLGLFYLLFLLSCTAQIDKKAERIRVNDSVLNRYAAFLIKHPKLVCDTVDAIVDVKYIGIDGKVGAKFIEALQVIKVRYNFSPFVLSDTIFTVRFLYCQGIPYEGIHTLAVMRMRTFKKGIICNYLWSSYPPDTCISPWLED